MGLYQSYRQVFVTNSPALLADGQTVDALAVGQIGIIDAKTGKAVANPTYAKNKAIKGVWGTPDLNVGEFGGVPNENEYSPLIKGKHILEFRAKKAQRGVTPLYTIGWSGDVADENTLFAKPGESKNLFIKITGDSIDRLYTKQGLTKLFKAVPAPVDDCDDPCATVDCSTYAMQYVKQINNDKDLGKFIRASLLLDCDTDETVVTSTVYKFILSVCDTGDDRALGLVQAKYPAEKVKRLSRTNAISTYEVIKTANTAPAAYVSAPIVVADCPTCPAGATLIESGLKYVVEVASTATITVAAPIISSTLLHTESGRSTYILLAEEALEAADLPTGATFTEVGETRNICQLPSTTTNWSANGTLTKRDKKYRITLADGICGTNRLADLQAAYPGLVVSVVNAAGSCVHTYETTTKSEAYETGCSIADIKFNPPAGFEGAHWEEVPPTTASDGCKCGILIESAFINRQSADCAWESFPYENDVVHVQASNYNPDFNASPNEGEWAVKQIRQVQYPLGHGGYIKQFEKDSKMYDGRFGYHDPEIRAAQGFSFQTNENAYYDQYVLKYKVVWKTGGGWASDYTSTWELVFYVPEGTGGAIEKTLASYVSSAGVDEDFESIV